jgi:peptidoglycan hydrolase CwlO-like protein
MTKTFAVILIISIAMVWTVGCQEEAASDVIQKHRLIAMENRELRAEAKKRDDEIKNLKEQFRVESKKRDDEMKKLTGQLQAEIEKRDNEIQQYAKQLAQCEQTKAEEIQNMENEQLWGQITDLLNKNSELTAEVKRLQAELAGLKGQK